MSDGHGTRRELSGEDESVARSLLVSIGSAALIWLVLLLRGTDAVIAVLASIAAVAFVFIVVAPIDIWLQKERAWTRLRRTGVATTATVTALGMEPRGPDGVGWVVLYRYFAAGEERRGKFKQGLWARWLVPPPALRLGDEIPVVYDPERPHVSGWFGEPPV
jgi:uncharacterized protein DUF3592